MIRPVGLVSLGMACAPHTLSQADAAATAAELFRLRAPRLERFAPVFDNAGVLTRQIVQPMDWYLQPRGWVERNEAYLAGALDLFERAATAALEEAGLQAAQVDAVITVSSTGIATPSLEARAMASLGFRTDCVRVPVFGLGCAGGAAGLALAARLAAAQPGWRVLFVCVELCSLAFNLDELSPEGVISAALFGDGAAAGVVGPEEDGFARIVGLGEHTWPDTLNIMGWRVGRNGLDVVLAQAVPNFARTRIRGVLETVLADQGLRIEDVDRFICHPGGAKVIEALESALELGQGSLDAEREVLAAHGNMSAPTVLFILDRLRRRGLPARSVLTSLGPGFTANTVTLEAA